MIYSCKGDIHVVGEPYEIILEGVFAIDGIRNAIKQISNSEAADIAISEIGRLAYSDFRSEEGAEQLGHDIAKLVLAIEQAEIGE